MLCSKTKLNKLGLEDVEMHMLSRITNESLLCSTNFNYLCFAFNCIINSKLKGKDTRHVLKRGFEGLIGDNHLNWNKDYSSSILNEENKVPERVNELAASLREKESTYFFTTTCNQRDHFGVSPIFRRLQEIIKSIRDDPKYHHNEDNEKELIKSIVRSCTIQIVRTWMEVREVLMDYICYSP